MSILERFKLKSNAKNYPSWENKEYIRLLDQSALDKTADLREKTLAKAEALLLNEMPLTPLFHWKTSYMISDRFALNDLQPDGAFDYSRLVVSGDAQ